MSITATELKSNLGKYLLLAATDDISITRNGKTHITGPEDGCGPILEKFYHAVQDIQYGVAPDTHGWNTKLC